ncbi:hypothetical protein PAXINDRAFT_20407 [Paxillus involutus ATCC 200175]|uniref:Uncharacterized protein n=1 Tax=Paxillus involutus ATCC 200175 TaxID=664439 RepID=A0A0C9TDX0_PAXIN|nr:hypothetical protein PAXINDRAFT_20407 [Paxillus involutus ATCC 200175]
MVIDSATLAHGEFTQDRAGTKRGGFKEHTTKEIPSYDTVPLNSKGHEWKWVRWELNDELNFVDKTTASQEYSRHHRLKRDCAVLR